MMGTAATSKTANHGKSAARCDNESCLITDEKSESFSFVKAQEAKQLIFSLVSSRIKEIPQSFQFVPAKSAGTQQQSLPLYLSNSILRI